MATAKKTTKKGAAKRAKLPRHTKAKVTRKMNDKTDPTSIPEQASAGIATDQSLETLRDILFGKQVRESDQRYENLENNLTKSINNLGNDLDKQVTRIEKNLEKLKDQLDKQAAKTADEVKNQFSLTANNINELHEELTTERNNLEKKAIGWNEDIAKQLEIVHHQLLDSKADRSTLSQLLRGMADSLDADSSALATQK